MSRSEKRCWSYLSGALKSLEKLPSRQKKKFRRELAAILLDFTEARLQWVKSNQQDKQSLYQMETALEELRLFPMRILAYLATQKPQSQSNSIATLGEVARQPQAQKKKGQK